MARQDGELPGSTQGADEGPGTDEGGNDSPSQLQSQFQESQSQLQSPQGSAGLQVSPNGRLPPLRGQGPTPTPMSVAPAVSMSTSSMAILTTIAASSSAMATPATDAPDATATASDERPTRPTAAIITTTFPDNNNNNNIDDSKIESKNNSNKEIAGESDSLIPQSPPQAPPAPPPPPAHPPRPPRIVSTATSSSPPPQQQQQMDHNSSQPQPEPEASSTRDTPLSSTNIPLSSTNTNPPPSTNNKETPNDRRPSRVSLAGSRRASRAGPPFEVRFPPLKPHRIPQLAATTMSPTTATSNLITNTMTSITSAIAGPAAAHPNYICTTKYTLLTFLPLNLFFQFRRFYNIYFLLGALSVIGGYSSLSPTSQIMPLAIVLAFSAAKEAIEDFNRYRADKAANNAPVTIICPPQQNHHLHHHNHSQHQQHQLQNHDANHPPIDALPIQILSMDVKPGDILLVSKGEKLPVDAIILSSSYDDGTAFIETAELDGETNLKRRAAVPALSTVIKSPADAARLAGSIQCEAPNENLHSFEGRIALDPSSAPPELVAAGPASLVLPLSMNNLVLRGAVLRNTDSIIALVVYTGSNTKIIRNLKQGGLKSSTLEAKLNWLVIYAFVFNAFLLITSVLFEYWHYAWALDIENSRRLSNPTDYAAEWYIGPRSTNTNFHAISVTISFFSLYTYVIPISLFVSLELTRLAQAIYMTMDDGMALLRPEPDGSVTRIPMRTNNSNLNEDLGCIEYIFSDKTGTLTQNSMRMAKWFCDGVVLDEMARPGAMMRAIRGNTTASTSPSTAIQPSTRDTMLKFLIALGLCHGVIPATDERTSELVYESQSPDETALLVGARNNGVKLVSRTKAGIGLEIYGAPHRFEILHTLEFTSTRKRMSVVVRTDDGILVYCKGADNVIMQRMATVNPDGGDVDNWPNAPDRLQIVRDALVSFSNEGLRTLVTAYRRLDTQTYEHFRTQFEEAERSISDRENMLETACNLVECELILLGCTAIEDRLQDRVPETIEYLLRAGIKLWLLTGDKQETAINIGMSSRLISNTMRLIILKASSRSDSAREIDGYLKEMAQDPNRVYALVVNGDVLAHALSGTPEDREKFLELGKQCRSVICTRVSPLQKALVVRLVRSSLKTAITLAIGDGANDVSMIQEAHVGVGIMGKEGAQAVRAADYAFGEFRFLERLLSVHGRYNYLRICNIIFYSFYKNLVFITIQWWFGFFNAWSGQTVYEEIFFIAFNVIYTSLPPLMYAIFERDVDDSQIRKYPGMYREVRTLFWGSGKIATWFLTSMLHSVFIFGSVLFTNAEGAVDVNGRSTGYWVQCYLFSTPLLISILVKMVVMTRFWVWPVWTCIAISILINIVIMFSLVIIESIIYTDYQTATITHALPVYYLLSVLMPALCNLPDVMVLYVRGLLVPSDTDIAMEEYQVMGVVKQRKTGAVETMV